MTKPALVSYALVIGALIIVGWLELATPFLTVLFAYFTLNLLYRATSRSHASRWLTIIVFLALAAGISYGSVVFIKAAVKELPAVLDSAMPRIQEFARQNAIELPFANTDELRTEIKDVLSHQLKYLGNFAKIATKETAFFFVGVVAAVSLFLNSTLDIERGSYRVRNNLYTLSCAEISNRFYNFYGSFATVMGAQIIISTINTAFTSLYVLAVDLPYPILIIGVTFFCGLLPIIGNLISNTVITSIAFTVSPKLAAVSLGYLIIIHKLEYFLNSKIIGDRIKNPVWLTLLALIVGERLMGIPGMILAPVILHYVKYETSRIEVTDKTQELVTHEYP
ncbi:MAG TPA: AI-2E family transporter [Methylomirabilota bacterium]|nr:AI-2E family transporter [Methylomirabilota bacterium]